VRGNFVATQATCADERLAKALGHIDAASTRRPMFGGNVTRKIRTEAGSEKRKPLSANAIRGPGVTGEAVPDRDMRRSVLTVKTFGKNPLCRKVLKKRGAKLREPSFTRNVRHQILAVSWAFDRSARLLTEITYRRAVMRCQRESVEPRRSLRAEHRFYWRIWIRRTVANAAAEYVARRRSRVRRLVASLERDADRISRKRGTSCRE